MPDPSGSLALQPLVLASASPTRASMLKAAGLEVEVVPSELDEAAVMEVIAGDRDPLPPADIASVLARAKAEAVSAARPGSLVIGADQTLELEGRLFVKPASMEEARRNLLELRGKTHALHSALALAQHGGTIWNYESAAWLAMRDFSPQFVGRYLAAAGEDILGSVGCYRIEGLGAQLFERIEGDWFTILGLPLLPLLAELRRRDVLPA